MMKKKLTLILIAAAAILAVGIYISFLERRNRRLSEERDRYKNNTEVLATACEKYRIQDSLSGARVRSLELSIEEFEQYRAADAAMIQSLRQKNRDLQSVADLQAQTIIDIAARPRDTVVVVDSLPVKAKAVHCGDAWYDFDGIMTEDAFTGSLAVRDSLVVSETVEHKRFLGFLWKTRRVKNRQLDVISQNPHTTIDDVVYVVIED